MKPLDDTVETAQTQGQGFEYSGQSFRMLKLKKKSMNDMAKFCIVSFHSTLLCFCEVLLQGEAITVQYHT